MDDKALKAPASIRSEQLQVVQNVLPKKPLYDLANIVLAELRRKSNWKWNTSDGLQVGIPQDAGITWIARESKKDLLNRHRPAPVEDGEPDPNAHRALNKQPYVWLLGQVLYYGLVFPLSPLDASKIIREALEKGNLKRPRNLVALSSDRRQAQVDNRPFQQMSDDSKALRAVKTIMVEIPRKVRTTREEQEKIMSARLVSSAGSRNQDKVSGVDTGSDEPALGANKGGDGHRGSGQRENRDKADTTDEEQETGEDSSNDEQESDENSSDSEQESDHESLNADDRLDADYDTDAETSGGSMAPARKVTHSTRRSRAMSTA